MQNLDSSVVHRHLDTKLKIAGMEALDLLIALLISAVMGFFFEGTLLGASFIVGLPLLFLATLVMLKRNKGDGYLKDWIRFSMLRGFYSASEKLKNESKLITNIIKGDMNVL
jgi:hypothetical protein